MKLGRSGGLDGIPGDLWKLTANQLMPIMLKLFNKILEQEQYPDAWKTGIIVPIYKRGERNDPSNYRGITLRPAIGKILSAMITNRLTTWIEDEHLLVGTQAGFRKGYSTLDNIFILDTIVHKLTQINNEQLYCAFVDFEKAFDFVNRDKLWKKFESYGIGTKLLSLIKNMYSEIQACVKVARNRITEKFNTYQGVLQGDSLSGLAFIMYVNDLTKFMIQNEASQIKIAELNVILLMFADDLILLDKSPKGDFN